MRIGASEYKKPKESDNRRQLLELGRADERRYLILDVLTDLAADSRKNTEITLRNYAVSVLPYVTSLKWTRNESNRRIELSLC